MKAIIALAALTVIEPAGMLLTDRLHAPLSLPTAEQPHRVLCSYSHGGRSFYVFWPELPCPARHPVPQEDRK